MNTAKIEQSKYLLEMIIEEFFSQAHCDQDLTTFICWKYTKLRELVSLACDTLAEGLQQAD